MAEGGIAAALGNVDPEDNWQLHFQDTMRGGQMINNWRMAQLHAQESPDRVYELETYGALFDRTPDGRVLQRAFGAHTYRRLCHVGDRTGLEMIRALQDRVVQRGIDVHMEWTLTRLLKDGDRVVGAFGYNRVDGSFVAFRAKAVILATGGMSGIWGRSASRRSCRRCTSSSFGWRTSTSRNSRWRSRPPSTMRWADYESTPRPPPRRYPASMPPARWRPACTARTVWAAIRCLTCWCSGGAPVTLPGHSSAT